MRRSLVSGARRILMMVTTLILLTAIAGGGADAGDRALTFRDLMAMRQIKAPVISADGSWIAYQLQPDRGDGGVMARSVDMGAEHWVPLGAKPAISSDGAWVAATMMPTQQERDETEDAAEEDKPQNGLALLNTATGDVELIDKVESFALAEDGRWLAFLHYKVEDDTTEAPADSAEAAEPKDNLGATLVLRNLGTGRLREIPYVTEYAFDEPSKHLVCAVAEPGGTNNGLYLIELDEGGAADTALHLAARGRYTHLSWAKDSSRLGFLAAVDDEEAEPGPAELWVWEPGGDSRRAVAAEDAPGGWTLPAQNSLRWTRDGERLFFGFKPEEDDPDGPEDGSKEKAGADPAAGAPADTTTAALNDTAAAPYDSRDIDALLADRELDVWHWDDPLIIPHQKKKWEKDKDRTYRAVYHIATGRMARLSDVTLPEIRHAENPHHVLGFSDFPYRKEITWEGRYRDGYLVDLETGDVTPVIQRLPERGHISLSPSGRHLVWFELGHWYHHDTRTGQIRMLTQNLRTPFANEDHDYPSPAPGYGVGGWIEDDQAVLIYDKYDIWRFPIAGGEPVNLTGGEGRRDQRQFRVVDLEPDREEILETETLLYRTFHEPTKNGGFYQGLTNEPGVSKLVEGPNRYRFLAKAEDADRILYTRESYTEFPDLWTAGPALAEPKKMSDANPEIAEFAWGEAELIEWASDDGTIHHGALIKPGNYEPGRRYPVVIYAYRLSSHRLHWFNQPVVNHRPSFPVYAGHGYAVLLPDIRFEVGHPGRSATKALVPAAEKLVEMGLADPDAIGLHGHSWGGYETAQVITETDVFKAAVAGAPVSNMTSAYSGIRLESGLARQFQYENGQSRIGASLDRGLSLYIENSPVFHARRINTPLLIQVGDEDGAVPWHQGVELYLAMRRLEKECHLLQYRGEPHHLKKYANKLDYSIKMKEFFDHHLKGEPAPAWMTEGVPYRGD